MASHCVFFTCVCVCFCLSFVTTSVVRQDKLFPLHIIHFNDFHVRFEETSVQFPICTSNDSSCLGGFPRLYHEIKVLHGEKPEALVLNAGDAFQGTYWYTLLKWDVIQYFMNMLPIDAHAIGNHEFDDEVEGLAPYLAALRAPVLVANIDTTEEPAMKGLYKPHVVVERNGRKIGIIGVITPDTKNTSKTGKVKFSDPIKVVKEQSQLLTDQGIDIIVVLSHCGIDVDEKMAKEAGEHIDVIVGGHSHSLLWNEPVSPSHEKITNLYPDIVETTAQDGKPKKVLVITASAYTKYIGNFSVYFDDRGDFKYFDGEPIFLNRSIPEDPDIKAQMQPYTDKLHKLVNEVVGSSEVDLEDEPCFYGECFLGDIITDAMLSATNEIEKSELPTVVLLPRVYIRGSIHKGNITRGAVINILPFANKILSFTLKGRYIMEALSKCLAYAKPGNPLRSAFMPQVAGMKVTIDGTKRAVDSVHVDHSGTFKILKPDLDYRMVTVDFLANGGNGFMTLKEHGTNVTVSGIDYEILVEYLKNISPVKKELHHRVIIAN